MAGASAKMVAGNASRMRLWRVLALLLACYVVFQDGMRVLRFSGLDPGAGTFAVSYARAPQFAPGFVEVTRVFPGGPMARAGVATGDHIRFDTDVRDDATPVLGELRRFTLDQQGVQRRLEVRAVAPKAGLFDPASQTRTLVNALSSLIAALFAALIIWRGGKAASTLLLGVALAAYGLANSAPWIGADSPALRQALNALGRTIQTMAPIALIAFALQFYREFIGALPKPAWPLLALGAALLLVLLGISDYLDAVIVLWPVVGDGQTSYTVVRLAGSVAALGCVGYGWRRSHSEVQQRYAMLVAALFVLVGARVFYLACFYLWPGSSGTKSALLLLFSVTGTGLAAPLFAYAILKQKVLDLGFVINRTLIYGVISFAVLITFGLIEWASEWLLPHETLQANAAVNAAVALAIFLAFHKIQSFAEELIKRLLFRSWHENEAALRHFVREAAFIGKAETLSAASVTALARFARGAPCALYRRDSDCYPRSAGSVVGRGRRIDRDDPLIVSLRADLKPYETSGTAGLALPMVHSGQLDGFFLLGPKLSGDSYRPDEIELLGWAAQQLGLDLHALKVARLERENAALEVRVSELRSLVAARGGSRGAAA